MTVKSTKASAETSASASPGDGLSELTAYVLDGYELNIRPAPLERPWMDDSPQRFAYRCLPLNIANAHGWEILCPAPFEAIWDGRVEREGVEVRTAEGVTPPAVGHFGSGVLTFHLPALFRTAPGYDLFVTGPINRPKDGIGPLSGVVETDWSPYTFTMNWLFTRADHRVRFEKDEPFCHIFPVRRGQMDGIAPILRPLSSEPELMREHMEWSDSRLNFNADLQKPDSQASKDGWQKSYFRGATPSGAAAPRDHRSKLRLKPFTPGG